MMSELLQVYFVPILVLVAHVCIVQGQVEEAFRKPEGAAGTIEDVVRVGDFIITNIRQNMMDARSFCHERHSILTDDLTIKNLNFLKEHDVTYGWLGLTRKMHTNWTSVEGEVYVGDSSIVKQSEEAKCAVRYIRRNMFSAKSCYDKMMGFLCSSTDCGACRIWNCVYLKDQGRCLIIVFGYMNWFEARRQCELYGQTLWAPSLTNFPTDSVNKFFKLLDINKRDDTDIWIGWALEEWTSTSQPGNQTDDNEQCVSFSTVNNSMWVRNPCTKRLPVVCQVLPKDSSTEQATGPKSTPTTEAGVTKKEAVYQGMLAVFFLMGCLTVCCFYRIRTCQRIKKKQRSRISQRDSSGHSSTIYSQPHIDGVVLRNSVHTGSGYAVVNKTRRNSSQDVKSWSPITECERSEFPTKGKTLQPNQLQASSNIASVYAVADSVPSTVLIHGSEKHEFSMNDPNVRPQPHRPITSVPNGGMAAAFQCGIKAFTQELSQKFAGITVATDEEGTT